MAGATIRFGRSLRLLQRALVRNVRLGESSNADLPVSDSTVIPASAANTTMDKNASAGARDPDDLEAQAQSLLIKNKLKDAENAILSALKQSRDNWEYYALLGRINSAQSRTHDARLAFEHAVALATLDSRVYWMFSEFLLKEGELRAAEEKIRWAIYLTPNVSAYHSTLGAVLLEQGWFDDAHSSLLCAIRLDRKYPRPRELLAKLLTVKGDYRGAERSLVKALALVPDSYSVLGSLAKVLEEQAKTDEAIACIKKLLAIDSRNPRLHIRISNQYRRAGRLAKAEQAIRTALALEPNPATYCSLSDILGAQSRTTEALAAISEACRLDPENQTYRAHLAHLTANNAAGVTGPLNKSVVAQSNTSGPPPSVFRRIRLFLRRSKIE